MKPNRRTAFTLVELLVVICIIVLLIAMLMPAFSLVHTTISRLHCQANLRAVHQVLIQYAHNYDGRLPCMGGLTRITEVDQDKPGVLDGGTPKDKNGKDQHLMGAALRAAGASPENFSCPLYANYGDDNDPTGQWQTWTTLRRATMPGVSTCTYKIIDIMGYVFLTGADCQQVDPQHRKKDGVDKYYPGVAAFAGAGPSVPRYDKFCIYPEDKDPTTRVNKNAGPLNGKPFAQMYDDFQNPPIVADLMCLVNDGTYRGFNHCELDDQGVPLSGGGSVLFLNGNVGWSDWTDLLGGEETAKPATQPLLDWSKRTDWWKDECGKYYFAAAMESNTGN